MVECLRLGFGGRRSGKGGLDFCWGSSVGEELDFIGNGATEVIERFADIGRVVISFIRVLGTGRTISREK